MHNDVANALSVRRSTGNGICFMSAEPHPGVVLVVEDPFIRKFMHDVLCRHGYQTLDADESRGVQLICGSQVKVNLLITNIPQAFLNCANRVPLLYVAAVPDLDLAARFRACKVLAKPFHPGDLVAAVDELAQHSEEQ
jgi:CheY-like chemotaxis protein